MARPKQVRVEVLGRQQPEDEYFALDEATAADMIDADDPAIRQIIHAAVQLGALGFDVRDPEVVQRAIDVGRDRYATRQGSPPPARPQIQPGEVVYYMRIGNRVKIGFSANLATRLATINPEELMAVEPGNKETERDRHVQFDQLRTHGEWFRLEGPLVRHIDRLKAGGSH